MQAFMHDIRVSIGSVPCLDFIGPMGRPIGPYVRTYVRT